MITPIAPRVAARVGRPLVRTVTALVGLIVAALSVGVLPAGAVGGPSVSTSSATSVGSTSSVLNGTVSPDGASTTYYFEYGTSSSFGSTTPSQSAGSAYTTFSVSATVSGLAPSTTYYYELVASNGYGTSYGGQQSFTTSTTNSTTVTTNRVQGSDRYQTSAAIALTKYPSGVPSGNVVVATGADFPDALAADYLAGQLAAPILLTPASSADPAYATVTSTLASLHATHVYIVGGTSAVGADVETSLTPTYTVTRIGGATRYDTMRLVDEASGLTPGTGSSGSRTAIIATGANYPDALAAGALSWEGHLPIILTDGTQSSLSAQARTVISDLGITHFIVMGGSSAITSSQVSELESIGTVDTQLSGADRTDTAAQLASYEQSTYGFSRSTAILASGQNFPDALSAGPWGGDPASIYLTETADSLGSYTTNALTVLQGAVSTLNVAGGTSALDDTALSAAKTAAQGSSSTLAPSVTTGSATNISSTAATLNGTVDPDGTSTTYYFEYGTTTSLGSTTTAISVGSGTTSLSESTYVSGLAANTTYYDRLIATNAYGTAYGTTQSFYTTNSSAAPTATTYAATNLAPSTATLNGALNPDGNSTSYYFEYGTTSSFGSTTTTQSAGSGTSTFSVAADISGLTSGTTYYAQLVAYNAYGTVYGGTQTFTAQSTTAPTVDSVNPSGGSTAGGTTVTVNGSNLSGATAVRFGGTAGTTITVNGSGTQLTVHAPAKSAATIDIRVTTADGTSATSAADHYTYTATPVMTSATVTPGTYSSGTTAGTTGTVEITFNEPASCNQAADYAYSNGGTPVSFSTCTAVGSAPATTWVLAPAASTTLSAPTSDTLTYTQASPTTTNATFAPAGNSQVYETSGDSLGSLS